MKQLTVCLFLICLTNCKAQTNDILLKNINYHGGQDRIDITHSVSAKGTVEIEAFNIVIPFNLKVKGDKVRFEQEAVEQGMDLNPGIIRTINEKAFVIIDERPMKRGFSCKELPSKGLELWQETKFLFPFTIPFYLKNNFQFSNEGNTRDGIKLKTKTNNGEDAMLFVNSKTGALQRHDFKDYHFQLGEVNISRKYLAYGEKEGVKYPTKWMDNRDGLELVYTINDIEFNTITDGDFDLPNGKMIKSLNANLVNTIASSYISALEKESPFSEAIARIKNLLFAKIESGEYKNIESHDVLAQKLSEDIIEITGDHHFGLEYNPDLFDELSNPKESLSDDNVNTYKEKLKSYERSNNYFIKETGFKYGYFYFHLTEFGALENVKDYFDAMMDKAAESKGLIIDLRDNSGGRGDFAHYMASYFLPKNTLLYTNVTKNKSKKIYTGDTNSQSVHKTLPVYILVNRHTASAGELVPYVLQNHERAIVVGETTFGMSHPSIDVPLKDDFVGFVPVSYSKHIKTGSDWESVGVVPDVKTESDKVFEIFNKEIKKNQ